MPISTDERLETLRSLCRQLRQACIEAAPASPPTPGPVSSSSPRTSFEGLIVIVPATSRREALKYSPNTSRLVTMGRDERNFALPVHLDRLIEEFGLDQV